MNKQPEITAQTRKRLMDAFWELYREKRIEQITVGAVAKAAGLNRGTFYTYFTDIYDLLEQLEEELLSQVIEQLDARYKEVPKSLEELSRSCAQVFALYDDKIYILLSEKGDPAFELKLKKKLRGNVALVQGLPATEEIFDYLVTFVVSSLSGLISFWYETGKKMKTENLLELIQTLMTTGILGYTNTTFNEYVTLIEKSLADEN